MKAFKQSPWLDKKTGNLFRDEFRLINDLKVDPWLERVDPRYQPIDVYRWIDQHDGESLLYRGFDTYAPLFPVIAYNGQVALWISPPPSGYGNAILIVVGHDATGTLRLVGGNDFPEPADKGGTPLSGAMFFDRYDKADDRGKECLVFDTVSQSISPDCKSLLFNIRRECEHFHTMPIYITVLTDTGSMFHAAKAVVMGVTPADFSYEYFGEVK